MATYIIRHYDPKIADIIISADNKIDARRKANDISSRFAIYPVARTV